MTSIIKTICDFKIPLDLKNWVKPKHLLRKDAEKIEKNNLHFFILPKEKQYQLIIILDKLDNKNLSELQYITNFGIPLEEYASLKNLSKAGNFDKNELFEVYKRLDLRSLLFLHKYFSIALKKIKNLYYKLGKFKFLIIKMLIKLSKMFTPNL